MILNSIKNKLVLESALFKRSTQDTIQNTFNQSIYSAFTIINDKGESIPGVNIEDKITINKGGKEVILEWDDDTYSMIRNFLPQNLSNAGVENLIVKTNDRFSPFLYVDKKAKFSNKLEIKCHTKSKPVQLVISDSYIATEILRDLKRVKFEPNTYLPYCELDFTSKPHVPSIEVKSFKETYNYVMDLYIKDNVFFGGGMCISLIDSVMRYLFTFNKTESKKLLNSFFIDKDEKLFRYKNDYITEELDKVLYNIPFNILYKYLVIRLDGSIKGSIENDYKFWHDDRFGKVNFWKEVKFYDNQFLVLFR